MSEADYQIEKNLGRHMFEGRRNRRGYYRERPKPLPEIVFELEGHLFETVHRDLWVTLSGTERVDRIKVTRSPSSRSARQGYPEALLLGRVDVRRREQEWLALAEIWLEFSRTEEYKRFPPVVLDKWQREHEAERLAARAKAA